MLESVKVCSAEISSLTAVLAQDMRHPAPDALPSKLIEEEPADRSSAESSLHSETSTSDHFQSFGSKIIGTLVIQEIRRPAQYAPPSKREHTDGGADATGSCAELGRFDYRPVAECYILEIRLPQDWC